MLFGCSEKYCERDRDRDRDKREGKEGERGHACICVCACVCDRENEWRVGMILITPMLISNAMPACCNQDSFFFCMTIVKFSCGKSMFRFTIEGMKYYVYCTYVSK